MNVVEVEGIRDGDVFVKWVRLDVLTSVKFNGRTIYDSLGDV